VLSIGTKIIDLERPLTLNGQCALCCRKDASFGAHCKNLNDDRPQLSPAKMYDDDSRIWKYKVYTDIRRSSSVCGCQMTMGLSSTAIFSDFHGYFFGNFRDKANNVVWRYATSCHLNI